MTVFSNRIMILNGGVSGYEFLLINMPNTIS